MSFREKFSDVITIGENCFNEILRETRVNQIFRLVGSVKGKILLRESRKEE